ncbi:TetR/AcrR family transcriptional regulator [Planosporangium mesophilum]|uniref:TetR family transcriptional regulator n=1 Tax=Planosporangium mesophilum TaxID=689768 RepID=A0A8J3TBI0_9ACTN|nr:TetR family transcriptional regulator [Planosporangium mesophilum]NJC83609.1 TetR/AcrR family transcriptional regulator [Planosporangium mesophilum]GII22122.1 TetR family transcriptional regulator [Planosporangium mesophilum]
MARTGRRPGNQDTREAILAAARQAFAEHGYDKASIRHIATSAGVDPALVHHYFGAKEQLFLAVMEAPIDPGKAIGEVLAGGLDGVGERLIRMFLTVWDSPAGVPAAALIRSAVSHDWSARMLREFVTSQILRRVIGGLDLDPKEGPLRASLVASQLVGLIMARYIVKIEPIASAPRETLVANVAPTIQRYLAGPLEGLDR